MKYVPLSAPSPAPGCCMYFEDADELNLIKSHCPVLARTFVESNGNTYMPLDSAMFLFAGFLEMEPHPDGDVTEPTWCDNVISASKFTQVWHAAMDLFFDEEIADEYTPFEWFQRASSFKNRLTVTERTVFYSDLVPLPTPVTRTPPSSTGAAAGTGTGSTTAGAAPTTTPLVPSVLGSGAASAAAALWVPPTSSGSATPVSGSMSSLIPNWLTALQWSRGSITDEDGGFTAVTLLEYFVGSRAFAPDRCKDVNTDVPSNFEVFLDTLDNTAYSSTDGVPRSVMQPAALANIMADYIRAIFPPVYVAKFHSRYIDRQRQFHWLVNMQKTRASGGCMSKFIDESVATSLSIMPSLAGLLTTRPGQFGVQLSVALKELAPPNMLVNGCLALHTIEQVENLLARRIALIQDPDMQARSIPERIESLRTRQEHDKAALKAAPVSFGGGGSSSQGTSKTSARGGATYQRVHQIALAEHLATEPYASLSADVLAATTNRDAIALVLRGTSARHRSRRPSAVLLAMLLDDSKVPQLIDAKMDPRLVEMRKGLPTFFGSVALLALGLPEFNLQLQKLSDALLTREWGKIDWVDVMLLPAKRTQAPAWSRAAVGLDTSELFESPGLIRLLRAPITALFEALGVSSSERDVTATPKPGDVSSVHEVLTLMTQTMDKYFTGDKEQTRMVSKANSHLWTGLLDEFAATYHGVVYGAPNADPPTLFVADASECMQRYLEFLKHAETRANLVRLTSHDHYYDHSPHRFLEQSTSKGKGKAKQTATPSDESDDSDYERPSKSRKTSASADTFFNPRLSKDKQCVIFSHSSSAGPTRNVGYNLDKVRAQLVAAEIATETSAAHLNVPAFIVARLGISSAQKLKLLPKAAALMPSEERLPQPSDDLTSIKIGNANMLRDADDSKGSNDLRNKLNKRRSIEGGKNKAGKRSRTNTSSSAKTSKAALAAAALFGGARRTKAASPDSTTRRHATGAAATQPALAPMANIMLLVAAAMPQAELFSTAMNTPRVMHMQACPFARAAAGDLAKPHLSMDRAICAAPPSDDCLRSPSREVCSLKRRELSPVLGPCPFPINAAPSRRVHPCSASLACASPQPRVIACGRDSWPSPWLAGCAQRSLPFDLGLRFCGWWSLATTWP